MTATDTICQLHAERPTVQTARSCGECEEILTAQGYTFVQGIVTGTPAMTYSATITELVSMGRGIDFDAASAIVSRAAAEGFCEVWGEGFTVQTTSTARDRFAISFN